MRIQGGIPVGGNLGTVAARPNPLLDPRFKIQGGEPRNKTPILPGKETKEYNEAPINIPSQFQLPGAMFPAGNAGGLMAQAQFPSTPVYYDEQMKQFVPRPGLPSSTPVKNYPGLGVAPKVPFV